MKKELNRDSLLILQALCYEKLNNIANEMHRKPMSDLGKNYLERTRKETHHVLAQINNSLSTGV